MEKASSEYIWSKQKRFINIQKIKLKKFINWKTTNVLMCWPNHYSKSTTELIIMVGEYK